MRSYIFNRENLWLHTCIYIQDLEKAAFVWYLYVQKRAHVGILYDSAVA